MNKLQYKTKKQKQKQKKTYLIDDTKAAAVVITILVKASIAAVLLLVGEDDEVTSISSSFSVGSISSSVLLLKLELRLFSRLFFLLFSWTCDFSLSSAVERSGRSSNVLGKKTANFKNVSRFLILVLVN